MIVDRFEGGYAVCEDMETRKLREYPIESLPEGVAEGDVLVFEENGITIDRVETEARRERVRKMFKDLWG
ncbi:MAG: DUF3006 domain-containing protein [Clostridiales bacterium]|jgi:hypothetical protein|nr:DUF3006 domain-containing protein [Clostridiales bacterium]